MRDRTDTRLRELRELEDAGIRVVGAVDTPGNAMHTYMRAGNAILGTSPGHGGVVLKHPLAGDAVLGVVRLLLGGSGQAGLVERSGHYIRISSVEFDLDAESLVGVSDHVLSLVLSGRRRAGEAPELLMATSMSPRRPRSRSGTEKTCAMRKAASSEDLG